MENRDWINSMLEVWRNMYVYMKIKWQDEHAARIVLEEKLKIAEARINELENENKTLKDRLDTYEELSGTILVV